jgi:hypothetical protein
MDEIIAERQLSLITENGEVRNIVVRIGKPEPDPNQGNFSCEYRISGIEKDRAERVYGLDAFQALQLTLWFISTTLNHYQQEANGRIYWQEPGDDMGFPEPRSLDSPQS